MDETRQLAEFACRLSLKDVPADVQQYAKLLILDQLGLQIAGSYLPWSDIIYKTMRPLSPEGRSSLVQRGEKLTADAAAFINSAFGHGMDGDDTYLKAPVHPGVVAVPSAMAVAEEVHADGKRTLEAIIAGYEVMLRVASATAIELLTRGHHAAAVVGPFGASSAAAHLLGLSESQTLNALAISGSFVSGLLEYTQSGGSVKRIHCAIPSQAGIRAAHFARNGLTGPAAVLEGRRGICHVFVPKTDISWLTRELGTRYFLADSSIKLYAACHQIHVPLDVMKDLRSREPFGADDVERITIYVRNVNFIRNCGTIKEPRDILGAQFSVSFCLALMLKGRNCRFSDFHEEDLTNPKLQALARRIDAQLVDPDENGFPMGVRLVVELKDGRRLEHALDCCKGMPENPATREDVEEKFYELAEPRLGRRRADEVIQMVSRFEELNDIAALADVLRERAKAGA